MLQLFKDRNFLLYWLSHFISVVGDHVTLLAFPWLALQLTGSPAMAGIVLALQGIPRAIFMLWGGAIVDRTNPRIVVLLSNIIRMIMVAGLTYMLMENTVTMSVVLWIAFGFGITDAFFYPASSSMVPSVIKRELLQKGNSVIQMTNTLALIFGPMVAGFLIAGEINTETIVVHENPTEAFAGDREGLARAFHFDAWSFFLSSLLLLFVQVRTLGDESGQENRTGFTEDLKVALRFCWSIPALRISFLGIAMFELLYQAPVFVGLPVLAKERFAEGSFIYGLEIAAYGGGAFIGAMIGGMMQPIPAKKLVRLLFLAFTWSAATLGLVVMWEPYEWAMFVFFTAGVADYIIWVHLITWIQKITPEELLGRVMGIFMFMTMGLLPVGNLIMGFLFEWALEGTLYAASGLMVIACLVAAFHPDSRKTKPIGSENTVGPSN